MSEIRARRLVIGVYQGKLTLLSTKLDKILAFFRYGGSVFILEKAFRLVALAFLFISPTWHNTAAVKTGIDIHKHAITFFDNPLFDICILVRLRVDYVRFI